MALWYAHAQAKMLAGEISYVADDVRATLHTASYTPDRIAHEYVDDLTNELSTGGGYTAGGVALGTKSVTVTAADSWADTWPSEEAVETDYVVRPTTGNGFLYRCVEAGTTSDTEPTWPTVIGEDVSDGTAVWECVGIAIVVIDCAAIAWIDATFEDARYLVVSDREAAQPEDQPLVALIDFGQDEDGLGGAFTVTPDDQGLLHAFVQ